MDIYVMLGSSALLVAGALVGLRLVKDELLLRHKRVLAAKY